MLEIKRTEDRLVIIPSGAWTLKYFKEIRTACESKISQIDQSLKIVLDGQKLEQLDTAGAKTLIDLLAKISIKDLQLTNVNEQFTALFNLVLERTERFSKNSDDNNPERFTKFAWIGKKTFEALNYLKEVFSFIGIVAEGLFRIFFKPSLLRPKELFTQLEEASVRSLPVVCLVTFLIGIVVAYLMAMQVEKYGGGLIIVNGVALTMCRELSPILVAIIMAGRSGSAYTAQLGAMRMNEEIDAITSIGLSATHVLVLPRFFALVISMPLLVFVGDLVGIAGGMAVADLYMGITPSTFIERLHSALPVRSFVVGMVKAPVFAAVIAMIGCRRGLNTEMNARSVGLSTTATVVESIVMVILLNAAFAVLFAELGI